MTIALVTGASGFVGRHLSRHLVGNVGCEVIPFDRAHGGDIRDYEAVRTAVDRANPDLIFHLAGQAYVPETTHDPRRGFDVNCLGTLNLLEAIRRTGSHARVHTAGTSSEYGYEGRESFGYDPFSEDTLPRPTDPYGVTKLMAGHLGLTYARIWGIPVVHTRAFNHTGPGHQARYAIPSFAKRVAEVAAGRRSHVEHGNLDARRNYTDVRDVVQAYVQAIHLEPGVYNICSPHTVSLRWVLDQLIAMTGRDIPTRQDDALYRSGSSHFPQPSCQKFTDATGWEAKIPLEQTLRDTLTYWEQEI